MRFSDLCYSGKYNLAKNAWIPHDKMFLILIGCLKRNIKTSSSLWGRFMFMCNVELCTRGTRPPATYFLDTIPCKLCGHLLGQCHEKSVKKYKTIWQNMMNTRFVHQISLHPMLSYLNFYIYHPTLLAIVYILTQSRIFLLRRNKMERL